MKACLTVRAEASLRTRSARRVSHVHRDPNRYRYRDRFLQAPCSMLPAPPSEGVQEFRRSGVQAFRTITTNPWTTAPA